MPPWRQPRAKWMVSLVNSHTNAISKRWHLWEIDLRFALNTTPGWCVAPWPLSSATYPPPVTRQECVLENRLQGYLAHKKPPPP